MVRTRDSSVSSADERILSASAVLFARFGYHGVSTREIATSAGVNEITVFRHYTRKRELYLAVLEKELRQLRLSADQLETIAQSKNSSTAIKQAFAFLSTSLTREPHLLSLMHYSVLEANADTDSLIRQLLFDSLESLSLCLEPWVKSGDLRCSNVWSVVFALVSIAVI